MEHKSHHVLYPVFKWIASILLILVFLCATIIGIAYYKRGNIREYVMSEINRHINGTVEVGDIDFSVLPHFPQLSISLQNVQMKDSLYQKHHRQFLNLGQIYLNVNVLDFLFGGRLKINSVAIEDTEVDMVIFPNGYSNSSFLRSGTTHDSSGQASSSDDILFEMNQIFIKNVRFRLTDSTAHKWFAIAAPTLHISLAGPDSAMAARIEGEVLFGGLAFDQRNGAFLKDKLVDVYLDAFIDSKNKIFHVLPSYTMIDKERYNIDGSVAFNEKFPQLFMHIHTPNAMLEKVVTCLPANIYNYLKDLHFTKRIQASIIVQGKLLPNTSPRYDLVFTHTGTALRYGSFPYQIKDMSYTGSMTNHIVDSLPSDDPNSALIIKDLRGNLEGIKFILNATMNNFIAPELTTNLRGKFSLPSTQKLWAPFPVRCKAGTGIFNLDVACSIDHFFKTYDAKDIRMLKGYLKFENGIVHVTESNINVSAIKLDVVFDKDKIKLNQLALGISDSKVAISGTASNTIKWLLKPNERIRFDIGLTSNKINLEKILDTYAQINNHMPKKEKGKPHPTKINLFKNISAGLALNVSQVMFKKIVASNVKGHLSLLDDNFTLDKFSFRAADGAVGLRAKLDEMNSNHAKMMVHADLKDVNVRKVFYQFDDFDQKMISYKNLEGKLRTNVNFSSELNSHFGLVKKTMSGDLQISLREGRLIDFEPIANLSGFIFRKRNFNDIEFAEIKNDFTLEGTALDISKMEISSTLLNFYLKGKYDLGGSHLDLHIKVPLSNLKARSVDYVPVNIGIDQAEKHNIYLRIYNNDQGKIKFGLDRAKNFKE